MLIGDRHGNKHDDTCHTLSRAAPKLEVWLDAGLSDLVQTEHNSSEKLQEPVKYPIGGNVELQGVQQGAVWSCGECTRGQCGAAVFSLYSFHLLLSFNPDAVLFFIR